MTVSTTHVENTWTGDGATTVFNFTFQVIKAIDVQVKLGGVLQPSGFAVVINQNQEDNPGGTLTFLVAPGNMVDVKAGRATALTQDVGFTNESKLSTKNLELVLDKLTLLLQEAKASTQGATGAQGPPGIQGPPGDIDGPVLSTDNALAIWNGTGGNILKNGPAPANNGDILKVVGGVWAAAASANSFPSGAILMWDTNMAAIPAGWEPMDGRTVTIGGVSKITLDTRGKYLLCASEEDTGSTGFTGATVRPGTSAGTKTHNHSFSANFTTSISNPGTNAAINNGASVLINVKSNAVLSHQHTGTASGNTAANSEASRPIEAALLLIVKVD